MEQQAKKLMSSQELKDMEKSIQQLFRAARNRHQAVKDQMQKKISNFQQLFQQQNANFLQLLQSPMDAAVPCTNNIDQMQKACLRIYQTALFQVFIPAVRRLLSKIVVNLVNQRNIEVMKNSENHRTAFEQICNRLLTEDSQSSSKKKRSFDLAIENVVSNETELSVQKLIYLQIRNLENTITQIRLKYQQQQQIKKLAQILNKSLAEYGQGKDIFKAEIKLFCFDCGKKLSAFIPQNINRVQLAFPASIQHELINHEEHELFYKELDYVSRMQHQLGIQKLGKADKEEQK